MIKLVSIEGGDVSEKVCILYSDTKAEVPSTGAGTHPVGFNGRLASASALYTAKMEVAILKSDDSWEWNE